MIARLEIKLCGQTRPGEAAACVEAGADALGVVFHAASPRHLTPAQAREIVLAAPAGFPVVGVFVDQSADSVARTAEAAGLTAVQLHGDEPLETVQALLDRGFHVVKALKTLGPALLQQAAQLPPACGLLVEAGTGPLPGGNAAGWDWSASRPLGAARPFALAGGLNPENIARALLAARPSAVDLSSGVEDTPGRKNLEKTRLLVENVRRICITWPTSPVFGGPRPKGRPPCPDNR